MTSFDQSTRTVDGNADADPLSYAISTRDAKVMDMVSAAVAAKETLLAFQPVVAARPWANGQRPVAFYEGLIRILDRTGRVIPARQFINTIEERELGRTIDCLALEHGFAALMEDPSLRLAINMSARSIGYPPWRQVLERGLNRDPFIAERLILEITESSAMLVPEIVIAFMDEMQTLGVTFALDDFGAGFTSFRYLRDFFFDILKIDKQFIQGIQDNTDNRVLTEALTSIGRHFEMFTVAEGVETQVDADVLRDLGVDCLQGYLTGVPRTLAPCRIEAKTKLA